MYTVPVFPCWWTTVISEFWPNEIGRGIEMGVFWELTLKWSVTVLVFGVAVSLASARFEFPIENAIVGSVVIYCVMGFWSYHQVGYLSTIGVALFVQLVDSTVGWFLSVRVFDEKITDAETTPPIYLLMLLMTLFFAAACATAGAVIARKSKGKRILPQE